MAPATRMQTWEVDSHLQSCLGSSWDKHHHMAGLQRHLPFSASLVTGGLELVDLCFHV